MISLFHSEDLGLLLDKAEEFKEQNPNLVWLRSPKLHELELNFLQVNLLDTGLNFLVEGLSCTYKELKVLLKSFNSKDYKILFLIHTSILKSFPEDLKNVFENKRLDIPKLTGITKKSYISKALKSLGLKLNPELQKYIKESLPANALTIKEFINNLSAFKQEDINLALLDELLKDPRKDVNYFSFWPLYLQEGWEWLSFYTKNVSSVDSLKKFSYALSYRVLEFKRFVNYRSKISNLRNIAVKLGTSHFYLKQYESLWSEHEDKLIKWIDRLILDIYFFHGTLRHQYHTNIELFMYFLLKKKPKGNLDVRI